MTGASALDLRDRLGATRVLVGAYAAIASAVQLPELAAVARLPATQLAPVGPVRVLAAPLPPAVAIALAVVAALACAAVAAGVRVRIAAPIAAATFAWSAAYRSSWGMIFHTDNLAALHLVALACAPQAGDAFAFGRAAVPPRDAAAYAWPLRLLLALAAATYLLAGIAKLRLAGLAWADGALLRDQVAIDNLRKALLGDRVAPLAAASLAHPGAFAALAWTSLVLELGAPLLVLGTWLGRPGTTLARAWALGLWGFHVGVVLVMNIWFTYPLAFVPFVPATRVERPARWLARKCDRRRGR